MTDAPAAALPLVVSFYTRDWIYPQHAERLRAECARLGVDHRIEERPSRGGYIQNSCIKPFFIRDCLHAARRPVLWIDVDGSLLQPPLLLCDLAYDFQARRMNPAHRRRIWHVGTLWLNPTAATLEFVDEWCARTGDMTDESSLDQTWKSREWRLRTRDLPPEYFFIVEQNRAIPPEVVVAHRLSSGESKRQQTALFMRYEETIG